MVQRLQGLLWKLITVGSEHQARSVSKIYRLLPLLQECPPFGLLTTLVLKGGIDSMAGHEALPEHTAALFSSGLLAALQQGVAIETARTDRSAQVGWFDDWQALLGSPAHCCLRSRCLQLLLLVVQCGY